MHQQPPEDNRRLVSPNNLEQKAARSKPLIFSSNLSRLYISQSSEVQNVRQLSVEKWHKTPRYPLTKQNSQSYKCSFQKSQSALEKQHLARITTKIQQPTIEVWQKEIPQCSLKIKDFKRASTQLSDWKVDQEFPKKRLPNQVQGEGGEDQWNQV